MDQDDDQGGGQEQENWPEYDAPVGNDAPDDQGDEATQDGNDRAATAGADGEDDQQQQAGQPAPQDRNGRMIPAYRLEEQRTRYERDLESANRKLQQLERMVQSVVGGQGQPGQATPQLTPEQQRLRTEFLKLFPEFESLVQLSPKAKDLLGLTERIPAMDRENEAFYNRVAVNTRTRLAAEAAKAYGLQKLDNDTERVVRNAFIEWVRVDEARNDRYEGQDPTLVTDFLTFFRRFAGGQQQQRAQNAQAIRKAQTNKQLPRGGNSSNRVPPTNPNARKPAGNTDEDPFDRIGARAWNALQAQRDAEA